MGSSRYALTQFSNGDYPGADQQQDDLAAIGQSGAPSLPDDHGDTPSATTSTLGAAETDTARGVIGDRHDQDVLRYDHGTCPVTIEVRTAETGPNLDAQLRVLDSASRLVAAANPAVAQPSSGAVTGTDASLTLPERPAGTLFIEVDGVGQGEMPTSGYSDYGSVGRYTVTVSGCTGTSSGAGTGTPPQPATAPGRARIGKAYPGARGGKVTAKATWTAPLSDGGSPITGYRVTVRRVSLDGDVLSTVTSVRPASARAWTARLPRGYHRFSVAALNAKGPGATSALSNRARAR